MMSNSKLIKAFKGIVVNWTLSSLRGVILNYAFSPFNGALVESSRKN